MQMAQEISKYNVWIWRYKWTVQTLGEVSRKESKSVIIQTKYELFGKLKIPQIKETPKSFDLVSY